LYFNRFNAFHNPSGNNGIMAEPSLLVDLIILLNFSIQCDMFRMKGKVNDLFVDKIEVEEEAQL